MKAADLALILSIGISASLGAVLGILRSKIFASKVKSILYLFFYSLSGALFLFAIYTAWFYWEESKILIVLSIVSAGCLAVATWSFLVFKDTYTSKELDPIVNKWTSNGDRNEIKLFGGDLNFFGQRPSNMDGNAQYIHLRKERFDRVLILCEVPVQNAKKIRYGKILSDMPEATLKFYNPDRADLRVRGRIIRVQGVNKLLVYTKVRSELYQAIETDMGNSNGALYSSIWDLIWDLALTPTPTQVNEYKDLYQAQQV